MLTFSCLLLATFTGAGGQILPQEQDDLARQKLATLKKQLPTVLEQHGWVDEIHREVYNWGQVSAWELQYEVKLVTRITPTMAKITIAQHCIQPYCRENDRHCYVTIYLGFFDGHWTTSRFEGTGRFNEKDEASINEIRELMVEIDEASHRDVDVTRQLP